MDAAIIIARDDELAQLSYPWYPFAARVSQHTVQRYPPRDDVVRSHLARSIDDDTDADSR